VTSEVDRLDNEGSALTKDLMKLRTSEQNLASNVPAAPSAESVRIGWIVAGRVRVRWSRPHETSDKRSISHRFARKDTDLIKSSEPLLAFLILCNQCKSVASFWISRRVTRDVF